MRGVGEREFLRLFHKRMGIHPRGGKACRALRGQASAREEVDEGGWRREAKGFLPVGE